MYARELVLVCAHVRACGCEHVHVGALESACKNTCGMYTRLQIHARERVHWRIKDIEREREREVILSALS